MEGSILKPLFDIDAIIDYPMSVAVYIRENLWNSKYFIDLKDEYYLKCIFATMPNKDPMPRLVTERYSDRCDKLYDDFLKDKELPNYFKTYAIANVINVYNDTGFTDSTVLVNNDEEEKFIKKIYEDKVHTLRYTEPLNINRLYGSYYTSDLQNTITKIKDPEYITFHVTKMRWNMEPSSNFTIPKVDIVKLLHDSNKIKFIDPYNEFLLPEEDI